MKWRAPKILVLLFVLACMGVSHQAWAEVDENCASQLLSRQQALIHHVSELNSALLEHGEKSDMQILYLRLKVEEELVRNQKQLSESLQQELRSGPLSRRYRLQEMSSSDLKQFYLNSLYAFYVRTSDLWIQEKLKVLLADFHILKSAEGRELLRIAKNIMSSFFSPYALRDQEMTSARASEYFQKSEWLNYPWRSAMTLAHEWLLSGPSADGRQLEAIWEKVPDRAGLTRLQLQKLERSICDRPTQSGPLCCQSGMACVRCPHNRVWLREDRSVDPP